MKGFKATYNMKCCNLTYEVGKTYTIDNFAICSHGFHFCEKQSDVLQYYPYKEGFILLEVEALGRTQSLRDKTATDVLKVLRVIPIEEYEFYISKNVPENTPPILIPNELEEFDSEGRLIYFKSPNDMEGWNKYDTNGNRIHLKRMGTKLKYDYEVWTDFDDKNRAIHSKESGGVERWTEFDDNDNITLYKVFLEEGSYYENRYEYDDKNN